MSLTEALGGFGKFWEPLGSFGRLCEALEGFVMLWKALGIFGRHGKVLGGFWTMSNFDEFWGRQKVSQKSQKFDTWVAKGEFQENFREETH